MSHPAGMFLIVLAGAVLSGVIVLFAISMILYATFMILLLLLVLLVKVLANYITHTSYLMELNNEAF